MARSRYVYAILESGIQRVVALYTVKHEMLADAEGYAKKDRRHFLLVRYPDAGAYHGPDTKWDGVIIPWSEVDVE